MAKNLYIHIGPQKNATTFLHSIFFTKLRNYEFIGYRNAKNYNSYYFKIYNHFINFLFLNNLKEKDEFIKKINKINKKNFIIINPLISADYSGDTFPKLKWQIKIKRLLILEKEFNLKIIFSKRKPSDVLYSLYNEYLQNNLIKNESFNQFIKNNSCKFFNYKKSQLFIEGNLKSSKVITYKFEDFEKNLKQTLNFFNEFPNIDNQKINFKKKEKGIVFIKVKPDYINKIDKFFPILRKLLNRFYIFRILWDFLKKIIYKEKKIKNLEDKIINNINSFFEWE